MADASETTVETTGETTVDVATAMTSGDAIPNLGRTTRRSLLGAGLGALVATIAASLGRPQPARGADGTPMVVGLGTTGTQVTAITNNTNNNPVFYAQSRLGTGLAGGSASGNGVLGVSESANGVEGRSDTARGVYGYSNSGPGVYAYSGANHAVWGYTEAQVGSAAAVAALRGQANTDQTYGAFAENLIVGTKGSLGGPRAGVAGQAPDALGFVGVAATAGDAGTALRVTGRAQFSRSGNASVPAGRSFVIVNVAGELTSGSLVLATPMFNRSGVYVQSAVPNPATGQIRINLNKVASSSSATPIAWFVIN